MRLRAEVLSVESQGDVLIVKAQAVETTAASWRSMTHLEFRVSHIDRNCRSLHVGRLLNITIEAL